MTIHQLKDIRRGDTIFATITRAYYKKVIIIQDRRGQPFRTGTEYQQGVPVKQLTLMKGT